MKHATGLLAVFGLCSLSLEPAAAVDPNEFAVGWPLALLEGSEFYDVPLTAEVYARAREISQMAILDANDEPMPFYRVLVEGEPGADEVRSLGVSPVYRTRAGEVITGLTVQTADEVVNLSLGMGSAAERGTIVAFVADARALDAAPAAVELDWRETEQPFMTSIVISHSEDLDDWTVVGRGTVASLTIDGARVRHDRIAITGRPGGYYRVGGFEATPEPWVLDRLRLVSEPEQRLAPVEPVSLVSEPWPDGPPDGDMRALLFDAGGFLPVRAVEVAFAQPNRWANATVLASASLDGPWRRVASSHLYYRVAFQGRELAPSAVSVAPPRARYWQLRPDRELDGADVELRLHYPQERLRFAASGTGPYQLVGGGLSQEAGPDPVLAEVWGQLDDGLTVRVAALGPMRELGGNAAFVAPSQFPWRAATLWGALLLGALLVGWMAIRLGRDAFGGDGEPGS